ncbi:AMP-binding protein [Pseudonocardia kongjuensis]|uniref:AMP-binding protein n=1 Tax=Pseudonocardia kongjuensis TaxID=102227 RepID=A0ABN1XRH7_9PSEU
MLNYVEFFDKGVALCPDRTFLVDGDVRMTFAETARLTHRIAAGLLAAGVGPDDPVATMAPNTAAGYTCQWGIIRSGAPWLPVNVRNGIEENLEVLQRMRARFLFFDSSLTDEACRILAEVPTLRAAVCIDAAAAGCPALESWLPPDDGSTGTYHERGPRDVVSIPTTSGTSGRVKGVQLSNASFAAGIANYLALMPYDVAPVTLAVAPLTHGAGYFAGTTIPLGGAIVMHRDTDPGSVLAAIGEHRITTLFVPPTLLYGMLAHPRVREHDYSSLRYVISGAAPLSETRLREAIEVFGPVFCQNYSQTEAPVTVAFMTPRQHVEALADPASEGRLRSVGTEAPFARFAIMDDDGALLGPGERGEIVVRGELVMNGYFEDPEQTAAVSAHGWHHTGDVGVVDDDGYLYVVDRKKDMIISGGFNVYPGEVEQVIWSHPGVLDCAVVGAPDEKWGERVVAVVEAEEGVEIDAAALRRSLRERLGGVKAPKEVLLWERLPRSGNGKVLKREIRRRFWQGLDRSI